MKVVEFLKPDKRVLILFSLLFLLSVIVSTFLKGEPGYICSSCSGGNNVCDWSGIGMPFAWLNINFDCQSCVKLENGITECISPMCGD